LTTRAGQARPEEPRHQNIRPNTETETSLLRRGLFLPACLPWFRLRTNRTALLLPKPRYTFHAPDMQGSWPSGFWFLPQGRPPKSFAPKPCISSDAPLMPLAMEGEAAKMLQHSKEHFNHDQFQCCSLQAIQIRCLHRTPLQMGESLCHWPRWIKATSYRQVPGLDSDTTGFNRSCQIRTAGQGSRVLVCAAALSRRRFSRNREFSGIRPGRTCILKRQEVRTYECFHRRFTGGFELGHGRS
jgi:hypothetical protein